MASAFAHSLFGATLGSALIPKDAKLPTRFWWLAAACSVVPDLDYIGYRFGIQYSDFLGHRGFTHSIVFAAALAWLVVAVFFRSPATQGISQRRLFVCFFLVTISHAVLDGLTNGGLGVAFFSPLSNERFFFPFRPLQVSPIGIARFFSPRAFQILSNEAMWVGIPSLLLLAASVGYRRLRNQRV